MCISQKIIPSDCPTRVLAPFLLLQVSSPPVPRGSDMRSIGLCAICIFPWREGKFELTPLNVSECDCKNDGFLGKNNKKPNPVIDVETQTKVSRFA